MELILLCAITFLISVLSTLFSIYCFSELKVLKLKIEQETPSTVTPMDINELAEKMFDFPTEERSSRVREEDLV
jgi:hypothetical protein